MFGGILTQEWVCADGAGCTLNTNSVIFAEILGHLCSLGWSHHRHVSPDVDWILEVYFFLRNALPAEYCFVVGYHFKVYQLFDYLISIQQKFFLLRVILLKTADDV